MLYNNYHLKNYTILYSVDVLKQCLLEVQTQDLIYITTLIKCSKKFLKLQ